MPVALQVRDARKSFPEAEALRGVSLDLYEGELLGLVGAGGAGKTTLLRAIAGRTPLDTGDLYWFGNPMTAPPGNELCLAPQEAVVYPLLQVRENLEIFARIHGVPLEEVKSRVDWALDWIGLTSNAHLQADALSTGARRRLHLACHVLHGPRVVLVDEPTLGVDPLTRDTIPDMLTQLRGSGFTILWATQRAEEAESRCDRILLFDHGTVIASGTATELVDQILGGQRVVTLQLERPPERPVDGFEQDESGLYLSALLRDVTVQLPVLLVRAQAAACRIEGIEVRRPSLSSVFTRLTGHDLNG